MTATAQTEFIRRIESLPPLPVIARNIQALTSAPNVSAEHVAKALRHDPAIASRILRVANSSFYGVAHEVTQISRAVVLLGSRAIRNLVLGLCARNLLVSSTGKVPKHIALWGHSVATAAVCDVVARRVSFSTPEEAFLAGLLHDAGKLAMAGLDPDFISALFSRRLTEAQSLDAERQHFGLDHAEAGCQILARWGLPDSFCRAAGRHHAAEFEPGGNADHLVAITMIANHIVRIMGHGPDTPVGGDRRIEGAATSLRIAEDDLTGLFVGLSARIEEALDMLGGTGGGKQNAPTLSAFSRILWVSDNGATGINIGQAFLAGTGSDIRRTAPADLPNDQSVEDVFFIDPGTGDSGDALEIASNLARDGYRKVAILTELCDGMDSRRRDPVSNVCFIPRVFTVFDLHWVEQQWKK